MIDPQSRSLEWIEQASALIPNIADTALVEKAIRALSLLESLLQRRVCILHGDHEATL